MGERTAGDLKLSKNRRLRRKEAGKERKPALNKGAKRDFGESPARNGGLQTEVGGDEIITYLMSKLGLD